MKSSDARKKRHCNPTHLITPEKKENTKKIKQKQKQGSIHLEKWASSDVGCGTDGDPHVKESYKIKLKTVFSLSTLLEAAGERK
jgi:hypothetical protein